MVLSGGYLLADIVGKRVVIRAGPGILFQQSVKMGVAQINHLRFSLSGVSGSIRDASIKTSGRWSALNRQSWGVGASEGD